MSMREPPDQPEKKVEPPQANPPGQSPAPLEITSSHITARLGPLPDPLTLLEYEQIRPGFADRIMQMAEAAAAHRRQRENKIIDGTFRAESRGSYMAFILAMAFLAASTWLIHGGHDVAGGAMGVIDIGSLVYIFIHGRQGRRQEQGKKVENPSGVEKSREVE